jgi:uncharacterized protein YcfL
LFLSEPAQSEASRVAEVQSTVIETTEPSQQTLDVGISSDEPVVSQAELQTSTRTTITTSAVNPVVTAVDTVETTRYIVDYIELFSLLFC